MENYMMTAVVILLFAIGVLYTIKHFKGESSCCGGGSYKPRKKKLSKVIYQKTFKVGGMHCEHCKNRVEEVVNDIQNVAGKVDLKKELLTISYAEDIDDSIIFAKIERIGYTIENQ